MHKILFFLFIMGPMMVYGQTRKVQANSQTEREIRILTSNLDKVVAGNDTEQIKQAKSIQLISSYLSNYNAILLEKELEDAKLDPNSARTDCAPEKIEYYLTLFKKERFLHIPAKYLATLGDVKTNCPLREAVRIYEMVGWEKLGTKDICLLYGCDKFKSDDMPKSRGAKEMWKFVGVKKFFTDKDNYGWRYFCILDDGSGRDTSKDVKEIVTALENSTKADADKVGDLENDYLFPPGYDEKSTEWKKRDQVTIW